MQILKHAFAAVLAMALVACGGGGGSAGTTSGGGGTSSGGSSGSGSSTGTPTLTIGIFNSSDAAVSSIAVGGGFVARATVKNASGAAVVGKLVTFAVNAGIATLSPSTALTNASGIAEVAIAPATVSVVGADTLSAAATVDGVALTGEKDFSVSATSLALSVISVGSANLASGGNTTLQVTALVGGSASTTPVNVTYGASCGKINGVAGSFSVTTNGNGVAAATYDAVQADGSLCSGAVSITASSAGAAVRSANITVAVPTANAVTFAGATPAQIYVAGSGAAEQSVAKFKVLSSAGTPLSGVEVTFSIVTNPGGLGLGASGSTAPVTATTNTAGEASVSVFSGTLPGPVKVKAALSSNTTVFAESQNLTVASGPPSQKFMSVSVTTFNIEGATRDGVSTRITARVADRQGNAVEDGTVVNFTAEGGQVASSCATVRINGISSCSVDFESQNPRPAGGRVSVLAFAEGTKDYIDVNNNNRYDAGIDTLVQIGNAYRDDDENGTYDAVGGEFVIVRGGSSTCVSAGAPFPSQVNTCDSNLATTVRQQVVILYSSSSPLITINSITPSLVNFKLNSLINTLLPMPAGTIISADAAGGTCAISKVIGATVPNVSPGVNPLADLGTNHLVTLKDCVSGDTVFIITKSPGGLETTTPFTIP